MVTWRVWIYDEEHEVDIDPRLLRMGDDRLTLDASGRVVFARTGRPWTPAPAGRP